jgi:hypothetical protein
MRNCRSRQRRTCVGWTRIRERVGNDSEPDDVHKDLYYIHSILRNRVKGSKDLELTWKGRSRQPITISSSYRPTETTKYGVALQDTR